MRYHWNSRSVDLSNVRAIRVEFTASRARVTSANVRLTRDKEQDANCRSLPMTVSRSRVSVAVAMLDAEVASAPFDIDFEFDGIDGRPNVASVTLVRLNPEVRSDAVPITRPLDASLVPDWIAQRGEFIERFGSVGRSRRRAHEVGFRLLEVSDLIDLGPEAIAGLQAVDLAPIDVHHVRSEAVSLQCTIAQYFREIDRRTTPPDVETEGNAADLADSRSWLEDRHDARAIHGANDRWFDPSTYVDDEFDSIADEILTVTRIFQAAEIHLPAAVGEVSGFEWAYELFVSGHLAIAHPIPATHWKVMHHGAPDGTSFLLFAELASLCIQLGIEEAFWRERFPHLVRAAVLFHAHPASDAAMNQALGVDGAAPLDVHAFHDGKTVPMRVVFELRHRHRERLAALGEGGHAALEDALTWVTGRIIGDQNATPEGPMVLAPDPQLFLPGQLD